MSAPYGPWQIGQLLRAMTDAQLAAVKPEYFQRWPAVHVVKYEVIEELIENEQSRRRHDAGRRTSDRPGSRPAE